MKNYKFFLSIFIISILSFACDSDKFLTNNPKGSLSDEQLATADAAEKMGIAAYATLSSGQWRAPYNSKWLYGSVRSDDAYKGGGGVNDQGQWNLFEGFTYATPQIETWADHNKIWTDIYFAISRVNAALRSFNNLTEQDFPEKTTRIAEMRFLRGHYYYLLKELFRYIPYIDEEKTTEDIIVTSNREFSDQELWEKIADDFKYAADNLPISQPEVGRATQYAAKAYLAKTRLFQAYEQDDQNQVININSNYLEEVVSLTDEVINSGFYGLFDDIRKNFLWDFDNGIESVFAVQYSIDDGTPMGNINMEEALNYNTSPRYGCCSFHQPSQNMVNAFKTDPQTGLPMFDTFNDEPMLDPEDFWDNTVDPRLDHTVGIPDHPFKYDPEFIYSRGWVRDPDTYGPFSPMRSVQHPDCACKTVALGYAYDTDSKNKDIIRFSEVLLWKAEALIQLGRQNEALPIINEIRERAKNSTEYLKMADGQPISNYNIELYTEENWTQDFAFKALRWERRLELAMEGERFSDLVRWGIAEEVMNKYLDKERQYRVHLREAHFTSGRDEYLPIPQVQIDLSEGLYVQNPGYD
jgi:starch-binding outer membrane protein, SusD/RagB family